MPSVKEEVRDTGVVRYSTHGLSVAHLTVECPESRRAYGLDAPSEGAPREGEWLSLEGVARVEVRGPAGSQERQYDSYMHEPRDGSPKAAWKYLELRDAAVRRVPPGGLAPALERLAEGAGRLLRDWEGTRSARALREVLSEAERVSGLLSSQLRIAEAAEEASRARVVSPDVSPDDV